MKIIKKLKREAEREAEHLSLKIVRQYLCQAAGEGEGSSGQAVKQENCSTNVVDLVHEGDEDKEDLLPPNIM